jgi:hypothetical protein
LLCLFLPSYVFLNWCWRNCDWDTFLSLSANFNQQNSKTSVGKLRPTHRITKSNCVCIVTV